MIINTGMRTDIPAFYGRWFINRLKAGYVLVRNPYDPSSVTRYRLDPEVVDVIGFCTKNPGPMLNHMDALDKFNQYWFVTITAYGRDIEPRVPEIKTVTGKFRTLSHIVGSECIGWRYDPIFFNESYTPARHLKTFEMIASELAGYTHTCVISFIDLYPKVLRNFPDVRSVSDRERVDLGRKLIRIAGRYGMKIKPCAEGDYLAEYGADCRGCMTVETYEKAAHCRLKAPKTAGARKECACYLSCDIGAYNTCGHMCRYCYANYSRDAVERSMAAHDPDSPFITGGFMPGDVIHDAVQKSWKDGQMTLSDYLR